MGESALNNAYITVDKVYNSISFVLAISSCVFVLFSWKQPIMILSQRSMMLALAVCVIVVSAGGLFGEPSPSPACWKVTLTRYAGMSAFFAILTCKEFLVWQFHRSLKKNQQYKGTVTYVLCWVYILLNALAGSLLPYYYWVVPYRNSGHLCAAPDKFVTIESPPGSNNSFDYFYICNHIVCFIVAVMSRNAPSICADAKAILFLSILGLLYVAFHLPSFYIQNVNLMYGVKFTMLTVQFLTIVGGLTLLIFMRAAHLTMTKEEVVQRYLNCRYETYAKVAGPIPEIPTTVCTRLVHVEDNQWMIHKTGENVPKVKTDEEEPIGEEDSAVTSIAKVISSDSGQDIEIV